MIYRLIFVAESVIGANPKASKEIIDIMVFHKVHID